MTTEFTLDLKDNRLMLRVNGLPHVSFKRAEFIGFQAWRLGEDVVKYTVEFYLKTREITCEYDTPEKWQAVLRLLDRPDLFVDFEEYGYER